MYPLMYPLLSVYVETAPYLERFGSIACCTLVCALYLVFLVTKLPPITARLVASVPVLFFCIVAPLAFPLDEVITRAVVAFTTTWLLVFKTLALTLDRGALVQPGLNTWQRVAFGVLPLSPAADPVPRKGVASKHAVAKGEQGNGVVHKAQQQQQGLQQRRTTRSATREAATTGGADDENNIKSATVPTNGQGPPIVNKTPPPHTSSDPARSALQLLSRFYTKVLVLWVIVHALTHYTLPPVALTVCYGFGLYCFLGVLMDGPGTLLTWALRVSIAPHFRSPYAATSLGNLWYVLLCGGCCAFVLGLLLSCVVRVVDVLVCWGKSFTPLLTPLVTPLFTPLFTLLFLHTTLHPPRHTQGQALEPHS